jgi:hypothetical protein
MQPRDSFELHNIPIEITVGLKKRDDNGELTNIVKGYAKRESAAATRTTPATNGSIPPWKR